jgi:hypothetical protein
MGDESSGERDIAVMMGSRERDIGGKFLNRTAFQTITFLPSLNVYTILLCQTNQQFFQMYIQRNISTFIL